MNTPKILTILLVVLCLLAIGGGLKVGMDMKNAGQHGLNQEMEQSIAVSKILTLKNVATGQTIEVWNSGKVTELGGLNYTLHVTVRHTSAESWVPFAVPINSGWSRLAGYDGLAVSTKDTTIKVRYKSSEWQFVSLAP